MSWSLGPTNWWIAEDRVPTWLDSWNMRRKQFVSILFYLSASLFRHRCRWPWCGKLEEVGCPYEGLEKVDPHQWVSYGWALRQDLWSCFLGEEAMFWALIDILMLFLMSLFLFVYLMFAGTCSPWSMSHLYNESMVLSPTKNYMPCNASVLFLLSVMWMISWMFECLNWNEMWWIHMSRAGLFMASWSWICCFAHYESNLFQNIAFWNPDGHWLTVL
jgi:hypothetical protein